MASDSSKQKGSMLIHLTREKRTNPQPSVGKCYVSLSNVSHENSGHLPLKTKMFMFIHLAKKRTVYATGHPQKVLRLLDKCDLRTLWPLVTQNKSNSIPTDVMEKETYSVG